MVKVGIVGGTGYTGVELLRLLSMHPQVELTAITSRKEAGLPVADMYPSLRGRVSLKFSTPDEARLDECDVVFFATPHGVAMAQAQALLDKGVKIIDLAADFRMQDTAEGFGQHIPKGYVYFAMGFSVFVEMVNLRVRAKAEPVHLHQQVPD